MNNQAPIIIIGAPRSGTNMLRDVLLKAPGVCSWPCDEINYIWRHGNVRFPSDEFGAEQATPSVKSYILKQFNTLQLRHKNAIVLEKTCANSLRCEFVNEVFPEARYIFIYRDGIDAVASAKHRWKAKLDVRYILQKLKYVPLSDLPFYGSRYLANRVHLLFSKEKRLAFWGPSLNDMDEVLKNHSLTEVCAIQWQKCLERAEAFLESLADDRVIKVRYEDFVAEPEAEISRLVDFIGIGDDKSAVKAMAQGVSARNVGKGRSELSNDELNSVNQLLAPTLKRLGYE